MNSNKIRSQGGHTRIQFNPLSLSCTLRCITPNSPTAQNVNANLSPWEYEPDRTLTPTLILPDVRVKDIDKVFPAGTANANLSLDSIDWRVDGKPIAEAWKSTEYEIIKADNDTRGTLKLKKNFASGEKAVLTFSGKLYDWRTGAVYEFVSDELALTCTETGDDKITLQIDKPAMEYDPTKDDLLLYERMVAEGDAEDGHRESYINATCYEFSVIAMASSSQSSYETLPDGMSLQLVELGGTTPIVANSEANPEVTQIGYPVTKFDLRLIDKKEYEIQLVKDGKVISSAPLSIYRKVTMPTLVKPLYENDINVRQEVYSNEALIVIRDKAADYPTLYYTIQWYTQAKRYDSVSSSWVDGTAIAWQTGTKLECNIEDTGIGNRLENSSFDVYFDVEPRGCSELVTDEDGVAITDEDGTLITD